MKYFTILALSVILAGSLACSSGTEPTPDFLIESDKEDYQSGETVTITMQNNTSDTLRAFGCGPFNFLYQQENDDGWTTISSQECGPLTPRDYYNFLLPGEIQTRTVEAGSAGRHRYGMAVQPPAASFPPGENEYTFTEFDVN